MSSVFKTRSRRVGSEPSSDADENPPILKMAEREDWALFRSIEGLCQKAGVRPSWLRRLVLKELADNALDTGAHIGCGLIDAEKSLDLFFIEDDGPGLDGTPEEIASLFSIRRPMRSSKLLRLPQRGALGNGLRVVAGAVLASAGSLVVITRNQRIKLRPQANGSTTVIGVTAAKRERGTRIEIGFGPALPNEHAPPFAWVEAADYISHDGKSYDGKTSPFWYDPGQFHELILAYGSQPLRSLIAQFDGCSGGKAGEIVASAALGRTSCERVTRQQAARLLAIARQHGRAVNPDRLGFVGRNAYPEHYYAIARDLALFGSAEPKAAIPYVVEAWARKTSEKGNNIRLRMLVNRTPVTGEIEAYRNADKNICFSGCGLGHRFEGTPKKGAFDITVSIITPYCPITSDGKAPNLLPFLDEIADAVETASKKAQRAAPKEKKLSQKAVVLEHLAAVIAEVSDDGEYRFNQRQLLYKLRPIVMREIGEELKENNYNEIITDYENEHGEIPGMYREPRGSIYHPHRKETITLGTLMVEDYKRPVWTFNKLVYIEKEGFSEALKDKGWAERHDCMLMSSKGFTTRAARDLVDKLAVHDEPVTVFCVHDADGPGTMIYQTFQEATRARGARKVTIVNLGLEPWEAIANGLAVENVEKGEGDKHKPVAEYVLEREDRAPNRQSWDAWLQTHRIELNAMTTPQFIAWLDRKMAKHGEGKLIPPPEVLCSELEEKLAASVRSSITERILREADLEGQISEALDAIERPDADDLVKGIEKLFKRSPEREWRDHITAVVNEIEDEE